MRRDSLDILMGVFTALMCAFLTLFLVGLTTGCGVGLYVADTEHDVDADVNTHKSSDTGYVCSPLLRHHQDGSQPSQRELDRYQDCVETYSENSNVLDPEVAEAVTEIEANKAEGEEDFQPADQPEVVNGAN